MVQSFDIVIVGGGIAGLAMATALKDTPFRIALIETRSTHDELNRGDVLHPISLEILKAWGVLPLVESKSPLRFHEFTITHLGKEVARIDFSDLNPDFPYSLSLDHGKIEAVLEEFAVTDRLVLYRGYRAQTMTQQADGMYFMKIAKGSEEFDLIATLVIGADGRNSFVRNSMNITPEVHEYDDSVVFCMPLTSEWTRNSLFILPPHSILTQVLPPRNRLRVAVHKPKGEGLSWMQLTPDEKMKYLLSFTDEFQKTQPVFTGLHIYHTRSSVSPLYSLDSRVLVGDAAHEVHPISTQGISLAIGDAYVLAKVLNNTLENLPQKLAEYERIRRPKHELVIHHTHVTALLFTNQILFSTQIEKMGILLMEHAKLLRELFAQTLKNFEYSTIGENIPIE